MIKTNFFYIIYRKGDANPLRHLHRQLKGGAEQISALPVLFFNGITSLHFTTAVSWVKIKNVKIGICRTEEAEILKYLKTQ